MKNDTAILRSKINKNSRKTYRGFAAYEARQGGVMGFYESKNEVLSTAHAAVAFPFFKRKKETKTLRAYPMQPYPQAQLTKYSKHRLGPP